MAEPETPVGRNVPARLLADVGSFCFRRAGFVALLSFLLLALSLWAAWHRLGFDPDRNDLLAPRDPFLASLRAWQREFPYPEDMLVVVEGGTGGDRQAAVRELGRRLEAEPELFRQVLWGLELPSLRQGALFYLDTASLTQLVVDLRMLLPSLQVLSGADNFSGLMEGAREDLLQQAVQDPETMGLLHGLLEELRRSLSSRGHAPYRSPWGDRMALPEAPDGLGTLDTSTFVFYNSLDRGERYLLLVKPPSSDLDVVRRSVSRLRHIMREMEEPGSVVRMRLTGEPVLMLDEFDTAARDSIRSAVIALVAVSVLVVLCFGEVRRPLTAIAAITIGIGWTMGVTAVGVGHLNLITVWVATMLVGLGADFGIHLIYRYEEERCLGRSPETAMRLTMATAGLENLAGCLTTGAVFYSLLLTGFRGLQELGIVAGSGVLLCYLALTTTLPALIFLQERYGSPSRLRHHENCELQALERWYLSRPGVVVGAFVGATLLMLPLAGQVRFDYNMVDLQDPRLESVRLLKELIRPGGETLMFGQTLVPNMASVDRMARRFEALPSVHHVESIAPLIPRQVQAKRVLVREVQQLVAEVQAPKLNAPRGAHALERTAREFLQLEEALEKYSAEAAASPDPRIREGMRSLRETFQGLKKDMLELGPGPVEDALDSFQGKLLLDVQRSLDLLKAQRETQPLSLQDLPEELRSRAVGKSGAIVMRIFPKEALEDRASMERFVRDLRSVDPQVTGPPVAMYHFTSGIMDAYQRSSLVALLTIALILLFHYRSVRHATLALVPMGVGILWMLASMALMDQGVNLVSVLALPLMLGIGSAQGLHVVDRYLDHEGEGLFGVSTGPGITMAALTILCGFVALATAHHQGIAGLGLAMSVGLTVSMLTAIVMLPALVKLLRRWCFRV